MKILPEFFQGSISQDLQEILDADPAWYTPGALVCEAKKKKKTSSQHPTTVGCKVVSKRKKVCPPPKKKTDVFLPTVPGWSSPPDPPAV